MKQHPHKEDSESPLSTAGGAAEEAAAISTGSLNGGTTTAAATLLSAGVSDTAAAAALGGNVAEETSSETVVACREETAATSASGAAACPQPAAAASSSSSCASHSREHSRLLQQQQVLPSNSQQPTQRNVFSFFRVALPGGAVWASASRAALAKYYNVRRSSSGGTKLTDLNPRCSQHNNNTSHDGENEDAATNRRGSDNSNSSHNRNSSSSSCQNNGNSSHDSSSAITSTSGYDNKSNSCHSTNSSYQKNNISSNSCCYLQKVVSTSNLNTSSSRYFSLSGESSSASPESKCNSARDAGGAHEHSRTSTEKISGKVKNDVGYTCTTTRSVFAGVTAREGSVNNRSRSVQAISAGSVAVRRPFFSHQLRLVEQRVLLEPLVELAKEWGAAASACGFLVYPALHARQQQLRHTIQQRQMKLKQQQQQEKKGEQQQDRSLIYEKSLRPSECQQTSQVLQQEELSRSTAAAAAVTRTIDAAAERHHLVERASHDAAHIAEDRSTAPTRSSWSSCSNTTCSINSRHDIYGGVQSRVCSDIRSNTSEQWTGSSSLVRVTLAGGCIGVAAAAILASSALLLAERGTSSVADYIFEHATSPSLKNRLGELLLPVVLCSAAAGAICSAAAAVGVAAAAVLFAAVVVCQRTVLQRLRRVAELLLLHQKCTRDILRWIQEVEVLRYVVDRERRSAGAAGAGAAVGAGACAQEATKTTAADAAGELKAFCFSVTSADREGKQSRVPSLLREGEKFVQTVHKESRLLEEAQQGDKHDDAEIGGAADSFTSAGVLTSSPSSLPTTAVAVRAAGCSGGPVVTLELRLVFLQQTAMLQQCLEKVSAALLLLDSLSGVVPSGSWKRSYSNSNESTNIICSIWRHIWSRLAACCGCRGSNRTSGFWSGEHSSNSSLWGLTPSSNNTRLVSVPSGHTSIISVWGRGGSHNFVGLSTMKDAAAAVWATETRLCCCIQATLLQVSNAAARASFQCNRSYVVGPSSFGTESAHNVDLVRKGYSESAGESNWRQQHKADALLLLQKQQQERDAATSKKRKSWKTWHIWTRSTSQPHSIHSYQQKQTPKDVVLMEQQYQQQVPCSLEEELRACGKLPSDIAAVAASAGIRTTIPAGIRTTIPGKGSERGSALSDHQDTRSNRSCSVDKMIHTAAPTHERNRNPNDILSRTNIITPLHTSNSNNSDNSNSSNSSSSTSSSRRTHARTNKNNSSRRSNSAGQDEKRRSKSCSSRRSRHSIIGLRSACDDKSHCTNSSRRQDPLMQSRGSRMWQCLWVNSRSSGMLSRGARRIWNTLLRCIQTGTIATDLLGSCTWQLRQLLLLEEALYTAEQQLDTCVTSLQRALLTEWAAAAEASPACRLVHEISCRQHHGIAATAVAASPLSGSGSRGPRVAAAAATAGVNSELRSDKTQAEDKSERAVFGDVVAEAKAFETHAADIVAPATANSLERVKSTPAYSSAHRVWPPQVAEASSASTRNSNSFRTWQQPLQVLLAAMRPPAVSPLSINAAGQAAEVRLSVGRLSQHIGAALAVLRVGSFGLSPPYCCSNSIFYEDSSSQRLVSSSTALDSASSSVRTTITTTSTTTSSSSRSGFTEGEKGGVLMGGVDSYSRNSGDVRCSNDDNIRERLDSTEEANASWLGWLKGLGSRLGDAGRFVMGVGLLRRSRLDTAEGRKQHQKDSAAIRRLLQQQEEDDFLAAMWGVLTATQQQLLFAQQQCEVLRQQLQRRQQQQQQQRGIVSGEGSDSSTSQKQQITADGWVKQQQRQIEKRQQTPADGTIWLAPPDPQRILEEYRGKGDETGRRGNETLGPIFNEFYTADAGALACGRHALKELHQVLQQHPRWQQQRQQKRLVKELLPSGELLLLREADIEEEEQQPQTAFGNRYMILKDAGQQERPQKEVEFEPTRTDRSSRSSSTCSLSVLRNSSIRRGDDCSSGIASMRNESAQHFEECGNKSSNRHTLGDSSSSDDSEGDADFREFFGATAAAAAARGRQRLRKGREALQREEHMSVALIRGTSSSSRTSSKSSCADSRRWLQVSPVVGKETTNTSFIEHLGSSRARSRSDNSRRSNRSSSSDSSSNSSSIGTSSRKSSGGRGGVSIVAQESSDMQEEGLRGQEKPEDDNTYPSHHQQRGPFSLEEKATGLEMQQEQQQQQEKAKRLAHLQEEASHILEQLHFTEKPQQGEILEEEAWQPCLLLEGEDRKAGKHTQRAAGRARFEEDRTALQQQAAAEDSTSQDACASNIAEWGGGSWCLEGSSSEGEQDGSGSNSSSSNNSSSMVQQITGRISSRKHHATTGVI